MDFKLRTLRTAAIALGALSLGAFIPQAGQAQTACGSAGYTIAQLTASGFECTIGDKTYSDFAFNFTTGNFSFTNVPDSEHTFSGSGLALMTGTYNYGYKITVSSGPEQFLAYTTDLAGSPVMGALSASNTLENSQNGDTSVTNEPGSAGNVVSITGTSVTFTGEISVTDGRIDTMTDSVTQTPGPLPILGAGAAFGFSRKLRNRIKVSA